MSSLSNKMDHNLTSMWVNFFMASGIPSDVGATYALTFAENRIQNDMLLDLNKEYLRDMGITRMGDVIAILRHAKTVHESTARDRVLNTASSVNKVPVAAVTGRATVAQPSSPASRMLEHYTRNSSPAHESSPKANIAQKRKSAEAVSVTETNNIKKTRLIRFGTTNTAKQTVVKEVAAPKPTVFARLGKNDAPKPAVPTIKKTVSTKTITTKPDTKAVFSRLGTKPDGEDQVIPMQKDALKYEGILKGNVAPIKNMVTVTTSHNNVRKIAMGIGGTMRADEAPVNIKEKLALPKSKSVKFSSKVEYKEIETVQKLPQIRPKVTAVFNKPERRLSMPEGAAASNSVKARLGITKKVTNLTITKNVFNRLGV